MLTRGYSPTQYTSQSHGMGGVAVQARLALSDVHQTGYGEAARIAAE